MRGVRGADGYIFAALVALAVGLCFVIASRADAAVISYQYTHTTDTAGATVNNVLYQCFSFTNTNNLGVISWYMGSQSGVTVQAQITRYTSTDCTSGSEGSGHTVTSHAASPNTLYNEDFTSGAYSLSGYHSILFRIDRTGGSFYNPLYALGNGTNAYYEANDNAPSDTSTRIVSIDPAEASTTASTSVNIKIVYYANSSVLYNQFDRVGYSIINTDRNYSQEAANEASTTLDTLQTYSDTKTLRSGGTYRIQAYLKNTTNGNIWIPLSSQNFSVVKNGLVSSIGTTTLEGAYILATSTCSITNITGCFQNALVWAIYPSSTSLDRLARAGDSVKTKPPFGYLFVNIAALQSLNASGTMPVSLAAVEGITENIFDRFDLGMGVLIYFFFGVWFFMHVRHIQL